jgi:small subunit ribosomal protein S21
MSILIVRRFQRNVHTYYNSMLIITVKEHGSIDRALKALKKKVEKSGQNREIRRRKEFTKPSVKRREEVKAAKHRQSYLTSESNG